MVTVIDGVHCHAWVTEQFARNRDADTVLVAKGHHQPKLSDWPPQEKMECRLMR